MNTRTISSIPPLTDEALSKANRQIIRARRYDIIGNVRLRTPYATCGT